MSTVVRETIYMQIETENVMPQFHIPVFNSLHVNQMVRMHYRAPNERLKLSVQYMYRKNIWK